MPRQVAPSLEIYPKIDSVKRNSMQKASLEDESKIEGLITGARERTGRRDDDLARAKSQPQCAIPSRLFAILLVPSRYKSNIPVRLVL